MNTQTGEATAGQKAKAVRARMRQQLLAREPLAKNHATRRILCVQMEAVLTQVDANESDFVHEMAPKKEDPSSA